MTRQMINVINIVAEPYSYTAVEVSRGYNRRRVYFNVTAASCARLSALMLDSPVAVTLSAGGRIHVTMRRRARY